MVFIKTIRQPKEYLTSSACELNFSYCITNYKYLEISLIYFQYVVILWNFNNIFCAKGALLTSIQTSRIWGRVFSCSTNHNEKIHRKNVDFWRSILAKQKNWPILFVKKIIIYDLYHNFGLIFFGLLTRCFFRRYRHVPKGCQFRKSGRKFDQVAKTSAIFRSFKRN